MAEAVPETIDKATKALPVVSQNFAVFIAIFALLGVTLLVMNKGQTRRSRCWEK